MYTSSGINCDGSKFARTGLGNILSDFITLLVYIIIQELITFKSYFIVT